MLCVTDKREPSYGGNTMKLFLISALIFAGVANADQIEREEREVTLTAPQAVMVKVNPDTNTVSIYQVPEMDAALKADPSKLEGLSEIFTVESNKIGEFSVSKSELDREGSTPAWWGRWHGNWRWNNWCGWGRGYNWYRPYYNPGYFAWNNCHYGYRSYYSYNNSYYGWYW
jgi:hypothetical protein